jgi:hypothetical protein
VGEDKTRKAEQGSWSIVIVFGLLLIQKKQADTMFEALPQTDHRCAVE